MTVPSRTACSVRPWLCLASLLLGACEGSVFPDDATEFTPPTSYRLDWRVVESCSGFSGDFDEISWFTVPGSAAGMEAGAAGAFYPDLKRIVLNEEVTDDHSLVRHEILHALQPAEDDHDTKFTVDCRGLVVCPAACAREAGGWGLQPSSGSRTLSPDSLDVTATVLPSAPGDGGYVALIVGARSARAEPVWIDLRAIPRYEFRCLRDALECGRVFNFASESAAFAPNETRFAAFIVQLNPAPTTFVGAFNTKEAPAVVVTPP